MAITSANQLELLQTAEAVAREKLIDPELVVQAMEDSLARAAKSRYGADMDIRVHIDRKTGRAQFTRVRTVVEDDLLENHHAEVTVAQAKQYLADPQIGDEIADEVPWADEITSYDEDHFITYLRLLDAEAEGADWREVARIVLHRNPDAEPGRARRCWEAHLKRARWMTEHGYRHLLDAARDG